MAVGADGVWLDNMGPSISGAITGTGVPLGTSDLRYPASKNQPPGEQCSRELAKVNLHNKLQKLMLLDRSRMFTKRKRQIAMALRDFKACRFSSMIRAQGLRVATAVAAVAATLGRKPVVVAGGLLAHSFAAKHTADAQQSSQSLNLRDQPLLMGNTSERVGSFKEREAANLIRRPSASFDGDFNIDSFFGHIRFGHRQCKDWPVGEIKTSIGGGNTSGELPRLETCDANITYPASNSWHANVRVLALAAQRGLRVLANVGRAGWTTVAQEYLPPAALHRWLLSAYSSFLFAVSARTSTLSLGVHPFVRLNETNVQPWLHPVFFIDLGPPTQWEALIESYRVANHSTYTRRFGRGMSLYNPSKEVDIDVPLGGEYIDPFDRSCTPRRAYTVGGQSGTVLVHSGSLI